MRDGDNTWKICFRSILDSFETLHTPSSQFIPPWVYENITGAHKQRFERMWNKKFNMQFSTSFDFRGLTAILMRNGPSNIIFFSFRDHLRDSLPESMDRLGLLVSFSWVTYFHLVIFQADFVSGACLGAFISTLFYPVNTTKTHMQKTLGGEFQSFLSVFCHLLKERGAWGMFRGVHVNYTRSFMSWGIINMSYSWLLGLLASWSLWSSAGQDSDEPWRPAEPSYCLVRCCQWHFQCQCHTVLWSLAGRQKEE